MFSLLLQVLKKMDYFFPSKNAIYRYRIGIDRYEKKYISILLISADKKIEFIGDYRYRPIWKKAYRSYTDFNNTRLYCNTISIVQSMYVYDVKRGGGFEH